MTENLERELAKCGEFTFGIEDHGCPMLFGEFHYESGGVQGFGYIVDVAFMMRFLCAVGVDRMSDVKGKSVWVTHNSSKITKVEPLHKNGGAVFDVEEWVEWSKRRMPNDVSPYEMRTGKK